VIVQSSRKGRRIPGLPTCVPLPCRARELSSCIPPVPDPWVLDSCRWSVGKPSSLLASPFPPLPLLLALLPLLLRRDTGAAAGRAAAAEGMLRLCPCPASCGSGGWRWSGGDVVSCSRAHRTQSVQ